MSQDVFRFIAERLVSEFGLTTLPLGGVGTERSATAFLYNHLVEEDVNGVDHVRELVLTADVATHGEVGSIHLRPGLTNPRSAADLILLHRFEEAWVHAPELGLALMSTKALHEHAAEKGYAWTTQEVTDGVAATANDLEQITAPVRAFCLGHDVTADGSDRPQGVAAGALRREPDGLMYWYDPLPEGFTGAPVFVLQPRDESSFRVCCFGLLQAGDETRQRVTTFDVIRRFIDEITA